MIEHEEIEPTEPDSITADLAAAWDASENDDGAEQQGGAIHEPGGEPSGAAGASDQNAGDPANGRDGDEGGVRAGADDAGGFNKVSEEVSKPPVGLSLEAREAWADTPKAVQESIAQREKDYEAGIVKYSQNAKRAEGMDQVLAPYQALFSANGGPGQTLPGLLQTASMLQLGSAPQKAQAISQLIKQFGVDIRTLDNLIVGQPVPAAVQQRTELEQMFNERLAPLQQQLQHYQTRDQQVEQQETARVTADINAFGESHEFYADVRMDMADLMDMAVNRGRPMTLEEAYSTACTAHPQISKMIAGRVAQQTVADKRNAASSIHGSPGGVMGSAAAGSVAAALGDAWDNYGQT